MAHDSSCFSLWAMRLYEFTLLNPQRRRIFAADLLVIFIPQPSCASFSEFRSHPYPFTLTLSLL